MLYYAPWIDSFGVAQRTGDLWSAWTVVSYIDDCIIMKYWIGVAVDGESGDW